MGGGGGGGVGGGGATGANATSSEPCAAPARPVNWSSTTPASSMTNVLGPGVVNRRAVTLSTPSWRPMSSHRPDRSLSLSSGSAAAVTCALVVVAGVPNTMNESRLCMAFIRCWLKEMGSEWAEPWCAMYMSLGYRKSTHTSYASRAKPPVWA